MKERGVRFCDYKTLRYPGHAHIMHQLIDSGVVTPQNIGCIFQNYEGMRDCIYYSVEVDGVTHTNEELTWKYSDILYNDDELSAMQIATGFSAVAAALSCDLYVLYPQTYEDVNQYDFMRIFEELTND
jgi:saccharopine dehydrogenase-like NADP-dependent oxidoreductase